MPAEAIILLLFKQYYVVISMQAKFYLHVWYSYQVWGWRRNSADAIVQVVVMETM